MPKELQNTIILESPSPIPSKAKQYTIIFITGNPGLIEYYRPFLAHLQALLSVNTQRKGDITFRVCGSSLAGFELSRSRDEQRKAWRKLGLQHDAPFALTEVIDAAEKDMLSYGSRRDSKNSVVIVGHSVGAYIALEIIQRHRARLEKKGVSLDEPNILGGICLFPTVTHIAESDRGKVLTKLVTLPFFINVIPLLCSVLLSLIPSFIIHPLVRQITRFQPQSAATTTAFLKSPNGVHQALYMGADEMKQITSDTWDSELWGAAHASPTGIPRPKLFFYFGEDDHWVADRTRDDLMGLRGRDGGNGEGWRPKMEIDGLGIPHAFPDAYSVPVAEKVRDYVEEIVQAESDGDVQRSK